MRRPRTPATARPAFRTLEEIERDHILRVLSALEGNRSQAARAIGIARSTLIDKIKRYQLKV